MAKATHDLAVKTGSYIAQDGSTKGRWQNIGKVIQTDDGGKFITISRTFNPAGVPNKDDRDSIAVSLFAIKEKDQHPVVAPIDDSTDIPF
jgi:hypothetical protein